MMMGVTSLSRIVVKYIVWTYVVFYLFLLAIGLAMVVLKSTAIAETLKVLSAWTSTFVFLLMFRTIHPQDKIWHVVKKHFQEKLSVGTVCSILFMQALLLAGTLFVTDVVWDVSWTAQIPFSWNAGLMLFGYHLIQGPLGEEIGWRGFVLHELQKKYRPVPAALIVGIAWGFWHAPLWFMSGYTGVELLQYICCFLISIVSLSVIITVCYTINRNLFIPILIHQLFNFSIAIQAGDQLRILVVTAIGYGFAAAVILMVNMARKARNG